MTTIASNIFNPALDALVIKLAEDFKDTEPLCIAGVANGGVPFAQWLSEELSKKWGRIVPWGCVNTAFHRDDLDLKPITKVFLPTETPWETNNAHILLADDVLCTGRTIRAAMSEIFDLGRPASIHLVVIFDRQCAQFPIRADYAAFTQQTDLDDQVKIILDVEHPERNMIRIINK